jgi:hypothetical protein
MMIKRLRQLDKMKTPQLGCFLFKKTALEQVEEYLNSFVEN